MHQQVGNHVIYMMSPPDAKDIINMNRLKCKHSESLLNCRVEHKDYPQETVQVQRTLKPTLKEKAKTDKTAKKVAIESTVMPSANMRENPGALKNCRTLYTLFIGGEALAECKEELE